MFLVRAGGTERLFIERPLQQVRVVLCDAVFFMAAVRGVTAIRWYFFCSVIENVFHAVTVYGDRVAVHKRLKTKISKDGIGNDQSPEVRWWPRRGPLTASGTACPPE